MSNILNFHKMVQTLSLTEACNYLPPHHIFETGLQVPVSYREITLSVSEVCLLVRRDNILLVWVG